jgi:hypothetical protein
MTQNIYRPEDKHPEPYQKDLNPDASKGLNWGLAGPHPEKGGARTAYDVKNVHEALRNFPDDELKQLVVLPVGARLEAKATYVNLSAPRLGEFTAEGNEDVGEHDYVIPKKETPYDLWSRLVDAVWKMRQGESPRPR